MTQRHAPWFGLLVVVGALAGSVKYWPEARVWAKGQLPIRYVRIEGRFEYLSKEDVRQALLPWVTTDFFSADIQAIHQATEALPWVREAEVQRIWPDAIDVRVDEQVPVARWGQHDLLNEQGERFRPTDIAALRFLPLLTGPQGYELRMLELFQRLRRGSLAFGLDLVEFHVSARRSWRVVLANGVELQLGRRRPLHHFQRFLQILPAFGVTRLQYAAKIDMRYPNGFAVAWRPDAEIDWKQWLLIPSVAEQQP